MYRNFLFFFARALSHDPGGARSATMQSDFARFMIRTFGGFVGGSDQKVSARRTTVRHHDRSGVRAGGRDRQRRFRHSHQGFGAFLGAGGGQSSNSHGESADCGQNYIVKMSCFHILTFNFAVFTFGGLWPTQIKPRPSAFHANIFMDFLTEKMRGFASGGV
jgi:hypothetical protein